MNKFCNEEKNMLENYPEIRDASLCKKPSFLEKTLWKRWHKGVFAVALSIALPTAMICALSACTPTASVDEQQQKAYQNYLSAWEQYETAVSEYNKAENPDKPNLPANLVITKTLDDKATAENLKSETQKLETVTANILNLCEIYNNNQDDPAQKAAYQNYLSAWNTYQAAVAEYEALKNEEKPEQLPANLVLSKNLDETAATQQLNQGRAALENATAEIKKLIEEYSQQTPTPPEPDKPMTTEEIVAAVTNAVESNIKEGLENGASDIKYLAIDYKKVEDKHYLDILVEYQHPSVEKGTKSIRLLRVPMQSELNEENIKNGTFKPKNEWDASTLVNISTKSADSRAEEALAKLKEDNQVTYSDLTNITTLSIGGSSVDTTLGCGATGVVITRIDANKVIRYALMVKSDGNTKDTIGENLINGTLGTTYRVVKKFEYEFGDNAILLGEIFQENDSN